MCCCFMFLGKIIVYLWDFVLMLLGLALIGGGVFIKIKEDMLEEYLSLLGPYISTSIIAAVLIVPGAILFLIGLFGCIGVAYKLICFIMSNAVGVGVLAAGTIYLIIKTVQLTTLSSELFNGFLTSMFNDTTNQNGTYQAIEVMLKCCGVTGSDSYVSAGMMIPPTCCDYDNRTVTLPSDIQDMYPNITCHDTGCLTVINDEVTKYMTIVTYVLISTLCVEIFTVLFDIIFSCSIKTRK